jgi:hypothetical protein
MRIKMVPGPWSATAHDRLPCWKLIWGGLQSGQQHCEGNQKENWNFTFSILTLLEEYFVATSVILNGKMFEHEARRVRSVAGLTPP